MAPGTLAVPPNADTLLDLSNFNLRVLATGPDGFGPPCTSATATRRWLIAAVSVLPGTDIGKLPGHVVTGATYLSGDGASQRQGNTIGLVAVFGLAALYTAIAIANTLVMSVRERASEVVRFRLAGGTPRQAMLLLYTEAALVLAVGAGLAAGVAGLTAYTLTASLRDIGVPPALVIPWRPLMIALAGCAALVFGATLAAGRFALRRPPLAELGITE